ncbi:MAG: type II toxin-antitoxin system RelE/ParE family toxin [Nitrospirae bacterium]|nr:type II toxin-antitoxin system RelE/ParE family toxin [Nitrospirota bacterium]MCL5977579.1 type II toxin-antitoxin system RelE/ParE family toxin [Nitrospirota bacterium]
MAKIRWTLEAEKWLRDIYDYIAQDNTNAAQQVVTAVYKKAQILKDFPEIGYKYRSEPEGDIRILLFGHYRIAYLIRNKESIDILGVFHGAMEIERYLKIIK